jgi:hypothetical protein
MTAREYLKHDVAILVTRTVRPEIYNEPNVHAVLVGEALKSTPTTGNLFNRCNGTVSVYARLLDGTTVIYDRQRAQCYIGDLKK